MVERYETECEARELIVSEKVEYTVDFVKNLIEQGEQVVVFTCFKQALNNICTQLGETCTAIYGGKIQKREARLLTNFKKEELK